MRFTPPDGVLNLAQTLDCGQSFRFYPVTLENNMARCGIFPRADRLSR